MRLPMLLLCLFPSLIYGEISFSVEEPSMHPRGHHRHHHHKHRHGRDHPILSPGGRDLPSSIARVPDRFTLNCPHVADADNMEVHIEVTWILDDTVLLKIRDGEQIVFVNRTTFRKKSNQGKSVVHVELAAGRHIFSYDELTGDFSMEINEVRPYEDFGDWQCHVTRRRGTETVATSTRKVIVAPPGAAERRAAAAAAKGEARQPQPQLQQLHPTTAAYRMSPDSSGAGSRHDQPRARIDYGSQDDEYGKRTTPGNKFFAVTRPDSNSVQISRDTVDRRRQTVVFDRSVTKVPQMDHKHHSVDYELSMREEYGEENDDFRYEHSKRARAAAIGSAAVSPPAAASALAVLLVAGAALW